MMNVKELVSFTADIRGIKFYPGHTDLIASGGFLNVDLVREKDNPHDANSILVVTRVHSPKILGHLEKAVAAAVAQIIDRKLPNTRLKRYNNSSVIKTLNQAFCIHVLPLQYLCIWGGIPHLSKSS